MSDLFLPAINDASQGAAQLVSSPTPAPLNLGTGGQPVPLLPGQVGPPHYDSSNPFAGATAGADSQSTTHVLSANCLVGIPHIETPGPLPAIPEICLFHRSWGDAVVGFGVLTAGVFIMLAGVVVLIKVDARVLNAVGASVNPVKRVSGAATDNSPESDDGEKEESGDGE